MSERKGPIEARTWPTTLEAFAVDTSGPPRLHGYDVEEDLARHYRFTDAVYLALTGELPDDARSRAFEVALTYLLPMSVAEAPIHATVLTGFCGAPPSGILSTAAVTLADAAMEIIDADPAAELPDRLLARTPAESASVDRLRAQLAGSLDVPLLARNPCRDVALVAVLRACGLSTPLQLATAISLARIPCAVAEAAPRAAQAFVEKYPLNTPPFEYVEKP
jgi:hypothetical protein